ncbi:MAG: pyruvate kinase [Pirellulaceae bacterium]|nr:pyruvate kinase [Pirellulaceae bacterium]
MKRPRPHLNDARSKIVATIGPACNSVEVLSELVNSGADIFRINAAHGGQADFEQTMQKIRQVRESTGFQVATLLDLAGPKIRLGKIAQDPLEVEPGMELTFVRGQQSTSAHELCSNYEQLVDELMVGNSVMLADGTIALQAVSKQHDRVTCKVLTGGTIRSRQGINLPGVTLSVSAMMPADVQNALWAANNEIDFLSLSFVRSSQDVLSLKNLVASLNSKALVIAKIEKREALQHLEAIVDAADGIMVARGDLGVEIDVAETPVAQKRIIEVCRQKLKPVIVATQMLESMHENRRPTRAEASDVANAILDGADACMLSGETAIGKYPVQSVETMNRIMVYTEQMLKDQTPDFSAKFQPIDAVDPITSSVTFRASNIAQDIGAKLIVVASKSGSTAWVKAKQRNCIHTLGISDNQATLRRMCLFWGIMPLYIESMAKPQVLIEHVIRWGKQSGLLVDGDCVVFVGGSGIYEKTHNLLVVHKV